MEKFDYLVVGSGLYGSIFAHEAKAHGKSVLVVDKRPNIAGNIYTENIEGINVHKYGAHIFHTNNKKVWNYITQFAEFNRFTNSPVANYKGELYSLPFNMYTFNKMWGVVTPEEAAAKIEEQRKEITGEPQNLEEQAISLVGRDIYEKLVKGYTEKQWGRDCKELPSFIKVIHKVNGGLSHARNAGMCIMTGEYVTFVDSDDILELNFVEEMLKLIYKYEAQIAVCKNSTFNKNAIVNKKIVEKETSEQCFDAVEATRNMLYQKGFDVAAWGKMYHKDTLQGISFPEGLIHEDIPTTYKVMDKLGIRFGSVNVELVVDKNNRVWPIDVGPRAGGNMIPDLLGKIYGADLVEMAVQAAMGQPILTTVHKPEGCYATHNLHSTKNGIYKQIVFSDELKKYLQEVHFYKKPGDHVERFDNAAKCLGIIFMKFPNVATAENILSHMEKHIDVQLTTE